MKTRLIFAVAALTLAGCEDREIKVYDIPKETGTSAPVVSAKPQWVVPSGWQELPPTGMRVASFSSGRGDAKELDVSVVTFPGEAGGLLANVNRWRGQMKLEPVADTTGIETQDVAGQPLQIVEFSEPGQDHAMLGAIFLRPDQSWFVKLTGSKATVAAEAVRFREFAQSFRFPLPSRAAPKSANDG
ncbi:MAG TPA: hypothetical protein VIT91_03555 [Chthoniobacterales bacterium]